MKNGLDIITNHVTTREFVREKMTAPVLKITYYVNRSVVVNFIVPLSILDVPVKMHPCALMLSLKRGN